MSITLAWDGDGPPLTSPFHAPLEHDPNDLFHTQQFLITHYKRWFNMASFLARQADLTIPRFPLQQPITSSLPSHSTALPSTPASAPAPTSTSSSQCTYHALVHASDHEAVLASLIEILRALRIN